MNINLLFIIAILNISCSGKTHSRNVINKDSTVVESVMNQMSFSEPEGIKELNLFSACSNYDSNLSTIASEIKFIPLDAEPLISDFHIFDIELSDDFIFLLEQGRILQFDKSGKFVKIIGSNGMGPGEFIQLYPPLQLDREKKLVYVYDEVRAQLFVYQFDGRFKGSISLKSVSGIKGDIYGCICIIDSTRIAIRQRDFTRFLPNSQSICFVDYKGNLTKSYPSYIYPLPKDKGEHFGPETNFMWENNGKFYSLEYGSDTIFKIQKDSLIPTRVLKGNLKLNRDELFTNDIGNKSVVNSSILRPNCGVFESDNFILFKMGSGKEYFFMIYNKQTAQFHRTHYKNALARRSKLIMDYFIDNVVSGLSFKPQYQSDGWALELISAIDIVEKKNEILRFIADNPSGESDNLKKIVQNITEMDNSVLMLVKFK